MRKLFITLAMVLCAMTTSAQVGIGSDGKYLFGTVTGTGQVGSYLSYAVTPPSVFTIDYYNTGTAASVCTYVVESSPDGAHWTTVAALIGQTTPTCTGSSGQIVIAFSPASNYRIRVPTYTAGNGTTAVTFSITQGRQ